MKIKQVYDPELTTVKGTAPDLPKKIEAELDTGVTIEVHVAWEKDDQSNYQKEGTHQVSGKVKTATYQNPLIEQRADPYIYKHTDGHYYFTGSYPEYDRIVLRRSRTIEGLSGVEEHVIWRRHESGIMSEHIWAPELHFINGNWYIYFAAGEKEDVWAIRPYVLECTDENPLTGEWVEKGQINTDFQSFSLDATTFEHGGTRYLIWAQKVENDSISNLYIAEMSNPWTITGGQHLLSEPEFQWEKEGFDVNEGAAVMERGGKIFISYSASATDNRYAMGLLTAEAGSNLLDQSNWKKMKEPVFISSEKTEEYGPGHNSFTVSEDGTADLLVYHARPYKEIKGNPLYDHNRHARIQELFWKTDGTPYFGIPGDRLDEEVPVTATIKVTAE